MFDSKRNCYLRVIPRNEKFTILGKFGNRKSYLYFTYDGSLVISSHQISKNDSIIAHHGKLYKTIVESEKEYDSIGKLMEYCFDIGVKEIVLISKNPFDDWFIFKNVTEITNDFYNVK